MFTMPNFDERRFSSIRRCTRQIRRIVASGLPAVSRPRHHPILINGDQRRHKLSPIVGRRETDIARRSRLASRERDDAYGKNYQYRRASLEHVSHTSNSAWNKVRASRYRAYRAGSGRCALFIRDNLLLPGNMPRVPLRQFR